MKMKLVFVDAENVGCSVIKEMEYKLNDKVLVFSRCQKIQAVCSQKLFACLSHYAEGTGQADFLIIATLAEQLAGMSQADKEETLFELVSYDLALNRAFITQCKLHHVTYKVTVLSAPEGREAVEREVLRALKVPHQLNHEFWHKLGIDQSTCTTVTKRLIEQGKIKRVEGNRRYWMSQAA